MASISVNHDWCKCCLYCVAERSEFTRQVSPKRTNRPGISTTNRSRGRGRGGFRGGRGGFGGGYAPRARRGFGYVFSVRETFRCIASSVLFPTTLEWCLIGGHCALLYTVLKMSLASGIGYFRCLFLFFVRFYELAWKVMQINVVMSVRPAVGLYLAKNMNVGFFSETMWPRSFKFCVMITSIWVSHTTFIPKLVIHNPRSQRCQKGISASCIFTASSDSIKLRLCTLVIYIAHLDYKYSYYLTISCKKSVFMSVVCNWGDNWCVSRLVQT